MNPLPIAEFLTSPGVILDVRSPGEFEQGHIPGAFSLPLFTNQERAQVGTCYKQVGREQAIELGLELVGPKLADFVRQAQKLAPDRVVRVHCWRGGMRSSSMGWLLETAGFEVSTLVGGYKSFRQWIRGVLAISQPIVTLGGMTGTGKTAVLHALGDLGALTLDLEHLANHRGSSYGALGLPEQPTTEQFENLVGMACQGLSSPDRGLNVWIEAESRGIGACRVPPELFNLMVRAPIVEIIRSEAERIDHLLEIYGQTDPDLLIAATERISKRLGRERTKEAVGHIRSGDLAPAIAIVLDYYDRSYRYDLERRGVTILTVDVTGLDAMAGAQKVLNAIKHFPEAITSVSLRLAQGAN